MKLSKISWLILAVGILVITFAGLGLTHSQQLNEETQVSEELSVAELRLSKLDLTQLYDQQERLNEQLNQTTSKLKAARAILSQPTSSIVASDAVFHIAEACGVEVIEISSSDPVCSNLQSITCSVLTLNIRAKGDVSNLISFVFKLNSDFATGVVNSAEITTPRTTTEIGPLASIQLLIYTYQGD